MKHVEQHKQLATLHGGGSGVSEKKARTGDMPRHNFSRRAPFSAVYTYLSME